MNPSPKPDGRAARRQQILDAGESCLLRQGYEGLKMDDVATAAQVAKGTVYLYFPSRDALCAAVAERSMASRFDALQTAADSQENGLAAIRVVLESILSYFDERPELVRVLIDWWRRPHVDNRSEAFEAYRGRSAGMLAMVRGLFERGQTDGSIRSELDPVHDGLYLWATVLGTQLFSANAVATRARTGTAFDPAALRRVHIGALMRSLEAGPPAGSADLDRGTKP